MSTCHTAGGFVSLHVYKIFVNKRFVIGFMVREHRDVVKTKVHTE